MKKSKLIIIISIFIILIVTVSVIVIWKGQKDTRKVAWIEKTINKEQMETDSDCGVVSVKMLLDFYDIDVSYEDIKSKTNSTIEGTNWRNIKGYLKTIDNVEMIEFKENTDKAEEYLDKGYPLFICWDVDSNPEWSHYSILISINNSSVWMLDPEEKKSLSEYSLDYFLPCWKNENYWFCILEVTGKKTAIHELIASERTTVKSYDPGKQETSYSIAKSFNLSDTNEIKLQFTGMPIKGKTQEQKELRNEKVDEIKGTSSKTKEK